MDKKMKLLIAYDGSNSAETALDDLPRAGLPTVAEAVVMSVADIFMPRADTGAMQSGGSSTVQYRLGQVSQALDVARQQANRGSARLRTNFPGWDIQTEACGQSPAWAIVEKVDQWQPDLVVVGSHNHSALGRLFLGSVSQTVLTEARCSVRIARHRLAQPSAPGQILIATDGSANAAHAIDRVASGAWTPDTKAHLVAVIDPALSTTLDWTDAGCADERSWIENILTTASAKLQARGLRVSVDIKQGSPKQVIIAEAERLTADCIFLGARGLRGLERVLLGSVCAAVAARAQCSVEIVRPR